MPHIHLFDSGKGPDVLMLDDVSLEAYAEKGVLADLGSLLDSLTGDGTVLPNQAGAYRREDGSCPAISARFLVPMMKGSEACLAACGSLTELAG